MTWITPWVGLLILPYLYCLRRCPLRDDAILFSNLPMLLRVTSHTSRVDPICWLRISVVLLLLAALARPVLPHPLPQPPRDAYAISLILDASQSMHEEGRFSQAKTVLRHFMAARPHDRFALSVFADYAAISLPMTDDHTALTTALKHLNIGVAGGRNTALYEALYRGADLFAHVPTHNRIAILLTDGLNTVTSIPLRVALAKAKKHHLTVYTIGLGHDYQKPILQRIATETGGRFFPLGSPDRLGEVYDTINRLEPSPLSATPQREHSELYRYPLWAALLLMLIIGVREHLQKKEHEKGRALGLGALMAVLFALYAPPASTATPHTAPQYPPLLIALDLSRFMDARDVYPSRFETARAKLLTFIDMLPDQPIGLIGFSDQAYLITPPTRDRTILRHLIAHLDPSVIRRESSSLRAPILAAAALLKTSASKTLLILTSGEDYPSVTPAITLARKHHITVHLYGVGTEQGDTVPTSDGVLRSPDGTPLLTQWHPEVISLAEATGGIYRQLGTREELATLRDRLRSHTATAFLSGTRHPSALSVLLLGIALLLFVLTHVRPWRRT